MHIYKHFVFRQDISVVDEICDFKPWEELEALNQLRLFLLMLGWCHRMPSDNNKGLITSPQALHLQVLAYDTVLSNSKRF